MSLLPFLKRRTLELDQSWNHTVDQFPGTGHRFTRMCNNPETATLDEVLFLGERLELHPLFLVKKYGLGKSTLSDKVIKVLSEHQALDLFKSKHFETVLKSDCDSNDRTFLSVPVSYQMKHQLRSHCALTEQTMSNYTRNLIEVALSQRKPSHQELNTTLNTYQSKTDALQKSPIPPIPAGATPANADCPA